MVNFKWYKVLTALLPKGFAWNIKRESLREKIHIAITNELEKIEKMVIQIREESNPETCRDTLNEWVETYNIDKRLSNDMKKSVAVCYHSMVGSQSLKYLKDSVKHLLADVELDEIEIDEEGLNQDEDSMKHKVKAIEAISTLKRSEARQTQKILEAIIPLHLRIVYKFIILEALYARCSTGRSGMMRCGCKKENYNA